MEFRRDVDATDAALLEEVVKVAFGTRRKKLRNALGRGWSSEVLEERCTALGLDLSLRAEAWPPEAFLALARALRASGDG